MGINSPVLQKLASWIELLFLVTLEEPRDSLPRRGPKVSNRMILDCKPQTNLNQHHVPMFLGEPCCACMIPIFLRLDSLKPSVPKASHLACAEGAVHRLSLVRWILRTGAEQGPLN